VSIEFVAGFDLDDEKGRPRLDYAIGPGENNTIKIYDGEVAG
jgi:hypothetical protein